jgi:hypothetical protein
MHRLKPDGYLLTDFKRNTADYQEQLDKVKQIETIEGIRRGLEDMTAGRMRPAGQGFADIHRGARAFVRPEDDETS